MALNGSYQNGRTGYTAKTEWTAIQNIEENYSDLTIKLYLICGNRYDKMCIRDSIKAQLKQ